MNDVPIVCPMVRKNKRVIVISRKHSGFLKSGHPFNKTHVCCSDNTSTNRTQYESLIVIKETSFADGVNLHFTLILILLSICCGNLFTEN